ncbi:ABC transporter A family member 12 [Prunus yedoensis var. nudiflora]|uniref:ABC transporter A family member 12 n=1 Tax=Prunus yedoensis var. nudiflora TaxID=2094558 RepID=A0A314YV38_PRUYE|nr:ABC transporter A family member 12 [Prunus yedoensis var. nudiflora]
MGTESSLLSSYTFDPAFTSPDPTPTLSNLQSQCPPQLSTSSATLRVSTTPIKKEVTCVQALCLWRNSSSEINNELYKGYMKGNSEKKINEILSAYDFSNSDAKTYNVTLWYNSTTQAVVLKLCCDYHAP